MSEKKMIAATKSFDTIAKVCKSIFEAVAIICAIFAVLILIFGEKMFDGGNITLNMAYVKLYLSDEIQPSTDPFRAFFMVLLAAGSVVFFMISYGIKQFRAILAPMKEGRPFEISAPRKLRNIAWTTLACGCVFNIVSFVACIITTSVYPMEQIFSSPAIEKIEIAYTMDFNFVFVFCAIMFLSYIFDYGQKLQRESDETL